MRVMRSNHGFNSRTNVVRWMCGIAYEFLGSTSAAAAGSTCCSVRLKPADSYNAMYRPQRRDIQPVVYMLNAFVQFRRI